MAATTKGKAMNIYADIEKLKGIAEELTDIQRDFDERYVDLSEAIKRINYARESLTDVAADLEV
jgi:hypothetical protein